MYVGGVYNPSVNLPSGYTQLGYIESTGTQYIDTGFIPNQNSRVVFDFQLTNSGTLADANPYIFGARTSSSKNIFTALSVKSSNRLRAYYGATSAYVTFSTSISTLDNRVIFDYNKNNFYCGTETLTTTAQTFDTGTSMFLFAASNNGKVTQPALMKLFACKIYNNGTLVRDFIPCKNSSNTIGLYDTVNSQFYTSAEGTAFLPGNNKGNFTISKIYAGVNGVAKKIKKGYVGVNGIAQRFLGSGELLLYSSTKNLSGARQYLSAATIGNYALFAGGRDSYGQYVNTVNAFNKSLVRSNATNLDYQLARMGTTSTTGYAIFVGGMSVVGSTQSSRDFVHAYSTSLVLSRPTDFPTSVFNIAGATAGNCAIFSSGTSVTSYNNSLTQSILDSFPYSSVSGIKAAHNNNHAMFAGGYSYGATMNKAFSYNQSLTRTEVEELYSYCQYHAGVSINNYILFGGGNSQSGTYLNTVTAYDNSLVKTKPTALSAKREDLMPARAGDYALFAGGQSTSVSKVVDAYDYSLIRTQPDKLSVARVAGAAASIGNYALFAGGFPSATGDPTSTIDIYQCT